MLVVPCRKELKKLTGVDNVSVSLLQNSMMVEYDEEVLKKEIYQAVS